MDKKLKKEVEEARLDRRRGRSGRPSKRGRSAPERHVADDREREDPGLDDSWWGALVYNAFLSSTKAVLLEAHHGIDSIPHVKYPNPFGRRPKKKKKED